ncbi:hypothetical protein [Streptomyces sp. N50]|uniref:hypothetical protein n=1 Tax=Streptomyces sp. N50 TaxID=3081765 RepID=UPI002961FB77|nr:hypothetical protein [Streptomyces sp. N50]WOX17077.1 hypothetical protein R2B38_50860 [Streptomyces sp. N50]
MLTAAPARPSERMWPLRQLLERGRTEPAHKDAIFLLAAAILKQTDVAGSGPVGHDRSPD